MAIIVEKYQLGMVRTNCYLIHNDETKEVIIVDPADNAKIIEQMIKEKNLSVQAILLTHGHFDHILAANELHDTYHVPIMAHENEKQILEDPSLNLSIGMGEEPCTVKADYFFKDNEIIELLHTKVKVLHTPGHTAGGVCYLFLKEKMMLSGDTLFEESVGRTDFPTGSMSTLVHSIKEKLMVLEDEITVYPGHEGETSISHERNFNPYIK